MRTYIYPLLTFAFVMAILSTVAQQPPSTNFYTNIKNYDLSRLWRSDCIDEDYEKKPFPEPIGFIGENFQRFYIHYISVTKSKDTPYLYNVTGKTRVKNNICHFTGQIFVQKAVMYKEPGEQIKTGSVTCLVTLYEDSTQNGSGVIKGKLISNFYLNKKGQLKYDILVFDDGFSNNNCTATWTSYKTGKSKKCNWGDFRIPESDKLDIGAGEFGVAPEYINNGWDNYYKAWNNGNEDAPETIKARKEELKKWWL